MENSVKLHLSVVLVIHACIMDVVKTSDQGLIVHVPMTTLELGASTNTTPAKPVLAKMQLHASTRVQDLLAFVQLDIQVSLQEK